jgi:hypothetical protein
MDQYLIGGHSSAHGGRQRGKVMEWPMILHCTM